MKLKNVEDVYILSPIQDLMLLYSLTTTQSVVLCEQSSFTLRGKLAVTALKSAWLRVIQRHPILRTAFIWDGLKQPLQLVRQEVELPWDEQDWRHLSPEEQKVALEAFRKAEQAQGFVLARAPLLRLVLLQLSEDTYELIWNFHHLILDGWSISLVLKEVFAFYEAFQHGRDIRLPQPISYRQYIQWLQQQPQRYNPADTYWQQALKDFIQPTPLALPVLSASNERSVRSHSEEHYTLSREETAKLQAIAHRYQITMNTLMQGAWAILLSGYSGQNDVLFGITVSGRPAVLVDVEHMIGPFINNLPLRIQLSPDDLLIVWLKKLHARQVEMQEYEYTSPAQIQRWSNLPPHQRLYESLVVFENYPLATSADEAEEDVSIIDVCASVQTNYPLTLVVIPGDALSLRFSYECQRFSTATMKQVLKQFCTVLNTLATHPEAHLSFHMKYAIPIPEYTTLEPAHIHLPPSSHPGGFVAARNRLELQLVQIWEELFGVHPLSVTDNFFALGGHSLLILHLMERIQQQFGRQLSFANLFQGEATIAQMAELLGQQESVQPWSPLVTICSGTRKRPFFCIHPGPGSVFCYVHLARHLGSDQPFYGLQARGLDGKEEPLTSIEAMAAHYIEAIRTVQPQGPYLLGGHCIGGIIALEMAQQLKRAGQEISFLAVMDTPPPIFYAPEEAPTLEDDTNLDIVRMAHVFERFFGLDLSASYVELQQLDQHEQMNYLMDRLRMLNVISQQDNLAQVQALLRVSKANDLANFRYQPQIAPLRITLFRASKLPFDLDAGKLADLYRDTAFGWNAFSPQKVEIHSVPGDHITMLTEPHIQTLAQQLRFCLDEVETVTTI